MTKTKFDNLPEDIKNDIENKAITFFMCRLDSKDIRCKCGKSAATSRCEFELTGSKSGSNCNANLCKSCSFEINGKNYCRVHSKMVKK